MNMTLTATTMPNQTPAEPRIVAGRRTACGIWTWQLRFGAEGVPGAVWCPWRAEAARRPPMLATSDRANRPDAQQVLTAWRRARRLRSDGRATLNPREDLFVDGANPGHRAEYVKVLESLLREGTPVALTTRGDPAAAAPLVQLAQRFGPQMWVRIGLFGGNIDDDARWEPGLPSRGARLDLAAQLVSAGAHVEIELGPLLPFVNDDIRHWRSVVRAVARAGVTRIVPRVIAGTPALVGQIECELNPSSARLVQGWLARGTEDTWLGTRHSGRGTTSPKPATTATARALPLHAREHRLKRLHEAVAGTPVTVVTCACFDAGQAHVCHTPDPTGPLGLRSDAAGSQHVQQLPLFRPETMQGR